MSTAIDFNRRRKQLQMPVATLIKRSGVPRPTVYRILRGDADSVGFGKVAMVARVLGIGFGVPAVEPEELRAREARRKARLLVTLTQGTMGLESQAVSTEMLKTLEEETVAKLLVEKGKKLWS